MSLSSAIVDFHEARRRASLEAIMARLTGRSADLLSYEEVRQKLKARSSVDRGLKEIPLDAIVGSVGRYTDFTRSFLPRRDSDQNRWARVQVQVTGMGGLPPIEVYQIGEVYFVKDGNHRVSVARQFDATHIEAYVTEVQTKVSLSPDDQPDDLILKAEYADFLEHTRLDQLRPGADLLFTVPGRYELLEEHIEVHRYFMGLDLKREVSYEEAVGHWYDMVYLPVVWAIREQGVLRDFPGRTETDLYVWVSEHRYLVQQALGWEIAPEAAVSDLASRFSRRLGRVVDRVRSRIRDAVTPDELEAGPAPGEWRREHLAASRSDRLFSHILVAVGGGKIGWQALDQALEIARRENGQLRGLHVVRQTNQLESHQAHAAQDEFVRRCQAAGVPGELALEVGGTARMICERARWTDLVVVNLAYPPPAWPVARFGSGLRTLIRRCARPVLTVPDASSPMDSLLLAYDGSPKADEALFVATYLAGRWQVPLTVLTALEKGRTTTNTLARAHKYLEPHDLTVTYVRRSAPAAEAIMKTAEDHKCNLILMGGYGGRPVVEVVIGSTVDQLLRLKRWPVLICR